MSQHKGAQESAKACHTEVLKIRADFREGDEDSNFLISESGGPLH